jgi:macrodomain Ter protein organizer (MatP/YcbG family)
MCHLERKDNKINGYLRKILSNCMTFHISQSVRYVSRYQKHSNTNKIFAKKKLLNFLKSLKVPRLLYTI